MELSDKFLGIDFAKLPSKMRAKMFDGIDPCEFGSVIFDHKTGKVYVTIPKFGNVPFITIPEYKKLLEQHPEAVKYIKEHDFLYETS